MRRRTCPLVLVLVALATAAACTRAASSPGRSGPASTVASDAVAYHEAPMLTQQVKTRTLASLEERLPRNPLVVQPQEQVGAYGGVWHMAMVKNENNLFQRVMAYENLVRWDKAWTKPVPNVAQSFTASPDSRKFTFTLRQGLKWSDGQPFTADDVTFWYEAVYLNDDLHFLVDPWFDLGKDKLKVTKLDDYRVAFEFADPQGLFLQRMATTKGAFATNFPRHYMTRFHKAYNPDVDSLVAKEGVANWVELFKKKTWHDAAIIPFSTVPEFPTLFAWTLEPGSFDANGVPAPIVKAVRNPYYWKTDTDYNQLPYIDRLEIRVVDSPEDILPLVKAGAIDMQDRNITEEAALPENQAAGGYGLYKLVSTFSNYMAISFNETHTDPVKREIFRNKDFRIGLSYAIDRPAIIRAAKLDAEPVQVAPLPGSRFYSKRLATQYLAHDVALANQHLDRAGYSARDAAGFRLGPDGKRISFTMLVSNPIPHGNYAVHLPMIQAEWKAVGIELKTETVPRVEADKRWADNNYDVTAFTGAGGFDAILAPRHYVPSEAFWAQQGVPWSYWASNPQDPRAEEPPASVKESVEVYKQLVRTGDPDRQNALMAQILDKAADQFQVIGVNSIPVAYGVVKTNFHNVPSLMFSAAIYPNPAPTNPCQYYLGG